MPEHKVIVKISKKKKFGYNRHCVHVCPGDTITWILDAAPPFAIIVKALDSPLDWGSAVLLKGAKMIVGKVREDAKPGFYPYGICAVYEGELLLDDPEIIVRPPDRRGV